MKALKAFLFSLVYVGVYLVIQVIFSSIFMGIMMINSGDISSFNIDAVMELTIKASIYSMPFCIVATFLTYWLIFNIRKKSFFKALSLKKIKLSTVLLAIGFSICFYPLIAIFADFLSKIFPSFDEIQNTFNDMFNISIVFSVLYVCIMGPIMEEILTRGLIFNEMKSSTNFIVAIIIQAFLFGVIHLNMVQGIYAFILGLVYGLFREKFNSLIIVIVCHIVHNSYSIVLDYLPESIVSNDLIMNILVIVSTAFLIVFSISLYFDWKKNYKHKHIYIS